MKPCQRCGANAIFHICPDCHRESRNRLDLLQDLYRERHGSHEALKREKFEAKRRTFVWQQPQFGEV